MKTPLIIHAIAASVIFTAIIGLMDTGVIAPLTGKSYEMFHSILGMRVSFVLIFISTFFTGQYCSKLAAG